MIGFSDIDAYQYFEQPVFFMPERLICNMYEYMRRWDDSTLPICNFNIFFGGGGLDAPLKFKSNSSCGDDVLKSFNNASRDEDRILDQIYEYQLYFDLYYENLRF